MFILRADGDAGIGLGHVSRCLTLADELVRQGQRVLFVTRDLDEGVRGMTRRRGHAVELLPERVSRAEELHRLAARIAESGTSAMLVVDGYDFDLAYQRDLRAAGAALACIDDLAAGPQAADIILNQNLWAEPALYRDVPSGARLLLGPRYALLKPEFRQAPAVADAKRGPRVLVAMGGGDSADVTGRIAGWIERSRAAEVVLLAGPGYPHLARLRRWTEARAPRFSVVHAPENVAELMAGADAAVCGGGVTLLELIRLGVPSMAIVLAENQARNVRAFAAAGSAVDLGGIERLDGERLTAMLDGLLGDPERRRQISAKARRICDGLGAWRAAMAFIEAWKAATAGPARSDAGSL